MYLKKRKRFIEDFNAILPKYKNQLPIIEIDELKTIKKDIIKTNSWFEINKFNVKEVSNNLKYKTSFPKEVINCIKIKMILNENQKKIINKWMDASTEMYNKALQYIRENCDFFKNNIIRKHLHHISKTKLTNFQFLRKNLKEIRNNIQNKTDLKFEKNTKIHIHTLDYIIKQLTSNIKSAISNLINSNIKRFRIKFWKNNRPSKTIEIEKQYILQNKICPKILDDIKYEYNKTSYELPKINSNVKINYNSILDEYSLIIPFKNKPKLSFENKNKIISLDPGLRTFLTGVSENASYDICPGVNKKLRKYIKRNNKIQFNENISQKIKKKNEKMINKKIWNLTEDLHWKSIKFLTDNFSTILLGDMSAKSIVQKKKSVLSKESKVACLRTRYYEFRNRLEYKCNLTKTNYKKINEQYTSKICSICGNYNEKFKDEKIYFCYKCNTSIDRDINGARNIMIRSKL